jgi:hypothetical protein
MTVEFLAPRPPRGRSASAPHGSLINRVQKPALLDRLAQDDSVVTTSSVRLVHLIVTVTTFLIGEQKCWSCSLETWARRAAQEGTSQASYG